MHLTKGYYLENIKQGRPKGKSAGHTASMTTLVQIPSPPAVQGLPVAVACLLPQHS